MKEKSLSILLIEDQQFCVDIFKAGFKEHEIIVASNGSEAVELYHQHKPNMCFLDIGLPDISGFEVLGKIQETDKSAHIVMLSAMNNELYVKRCRELGAQGFLPKPYQKESIQYYIDRYINSFQQH